MTEKIFHVDYRFIVRADNQTVALEKVEAFLPEASDGIWYTENKVHEVEWWEMLDWNEMKNTWERLPEEVKQKIVDAGLQPKEES